MAGVLALGVFLAALLALVTGCNSGSDGDRGDARKGGSLLVGLGRPPDSLDPAVASSPEALQALRLAYTPPLTYRHAAGAGGTQIVAGLAERVPEGSADATSFSFTFRDKLRYSDGRRLQASDFDRAIRRARALNPVARRELSGVGTIVADERTRTVRIELDAPDPGFPGLLAATWAAPVPAGTPLRETSPPGIGPYVPKRPGRGEVYEYSRRRGFRLPGVPAGNADAVTGVVVAGPARRMSQTLRGRLDLTQGEPPARRLPEVRSEDKLRYREFQTLSARFVSFALARRPFRDEDMRRAVAFALDLQTISQIEEGFLRPTCNLIPPQVPGFERLDPCPYGARLGNADLVRAAKLVRRSRDRKAKVIVSGGGGDRADALASYGVQTLRKIGLRARRARTAAEARRAQLSFAERLPAEPQPARYLDAVRDAGVQSDAGALERDGTPSQTALRWAALDKRVVQGALVVPLGVRTTGVLLSERLDAANCLNFHPVFGTDLSLLCLR